MTAAPDRLRVLVVDDSAYNRQTIASMLGSAPGVVVVGRATNGKEALRLVFDLEPDVITLDLEMPEIDGFAFLRLLMHKRPTPVVVVSGNAHRENVFRALELGALDFVAKPSREVSPDLRSIEPELLAKIDMVRRLQVIRLADRARALGQAVSMRPPGAAVSRPPPPLRGVLAIGASTGGPPAIQQLLAGLPIDTPLAVLIAQHMPVRFTKAFAERLDRVVGLSVVEAEDNMPLVAGTAYVAPGGSHLEAASVGKQVVARVTPAIGNSAIAPAADRLFKSVGGLFGARACVCVLTGMGNDGRDGAMAAKSDGARILAEDPRTAIMPGMPQSVIDTRAVDEIVVLEQLGQAIARFIAALPTTPIPGG